MKDLLRIYRRYILTAASIGFFIIFFNLLLFFLFLVNQLSYKRNEAYDNWSISSLSAALTREGDTYSLPDDAREKLDADYAFAMLINQQGEVVWSQNLPAEIPLSYTLTDVASFTRWYLKDYAVTIWEHADGLFVAADPKGMTWKHGIIFSTKFIETVPLYLLGILLFNLMAILGLALLFGHRFYNSLKPLADGIEHLTGTEPLHLSQQGLVGGLAEKLNQASIVLLSQKRALEKRDNARTSWIAGVSHDIRTPLSLIMGHADSLEQNPNLPNAEQKEAASIKEHSLHIKNLIADLNLTSKLEYDSYPLRLQAYSPAALLRNLAAYYLNDVLKDPYTLDSEIHGDLEGITLTGDTDLMLRALRNLIDNSIRHNPGGCAIYLDAALDHGNVRISVADTGCGIPVRVIKALYRKEQSAQTPHIMGLRIVKQIAEAHGGTLDFELQKDICNRVTLLLPLSFSGAGINTNFSL